MFKRIFWMSTGVAVGASGAFWAKRKVEETIEQYLPEQVAVRAATTAKGLGTTVRQAAAEGREAMRTTEAELRARVEARTFVGDAPAPPAPAEKPAAPRRAGRVATHAGAGPAGRRRARR
ncbi:hypothetical protein ACE2AJ_02450 [Aquihabitans daechungensis]|uniref:hypothetical protein n=1 Tax=Aquihabitans daechungensis TaxID=1052257 RepID=UPI003BA0BDBB